MTAGPGAPPASRSEPGTGAPPRYACLWVPGFAAAALVRQDPALRGHPVAALTPGRARTVVAITPPAGGVRPGMSATEAAARVAGLRARVVDPEAERAAAAALREVAWATSPRVEVVAPGCVSLDVGGLAALIGADARIGARLAEMGGAVGLPVRVGIADTRTAARLAARAGAGVTVVPPGGTPAFLAPLPIALLDPEPPLALALERWGVRTLGALAALPAAPLAARLGPTGLRLRALAAGADLAPFVAEPCPAPCVEACTLEWEVTALPALAFVLDRLLAALDARLALRGAGAALLRLRLGLADGGTHVQRLAPAAPIRDGRTLLRLLLADLEPLRLASPVVAVSVEAEPAPLAPLQADLFAPPRPSPRELGETLGRLAALVGPAHVGAPAVADTHHPEAIGMVPFTGVPAPREPVRRDRRAPSPEPPLPARATLVRRRLVPPRLAEVECRDGRPVRVVAADCRGAVLAAAGPWRTEGEWWAETAWTREEWDVALSDGGVYRIGRDLAAGPWTVDAIYD